MGAASVETGAAASRVETEVISPRSASASVEGFSAAIAEEDTIKAAPSRAGVASNEFHRTLYDICLIVLTPKNLNRTLGTHSKLEIFDLSRVD
jgi:hypothetical protein